MIERNWQSKLVELHEQASKYSGVYEFTFDQFTVWFLWLVPFPLCFAIMLNYGISSVLWATVSLKTLLQESSPAQ